MLYSNLSVAIETLMSIPSDSIDCPYSFFQDLSDSLREYWENDHIGPASDIEVLCDFLEEMSPEGEAPSWADDECYDFAQADAYHSHMSF